MSAPRSPDPSPGALRKRRFDQRQRERIAELEQQLAAAQQQLAVCMQQRKQLAAELSRIKRHWIVKWLIK